MDLVKENSVPKATAQLLLVQRGLVHTNNPEPLVKEVEKVVYRDRPGKTVEKVVYKDRPPVEKVVYKSILPKEERIREHITDKKLVGGKDKGQRASDDKLTTPNEANSLLASEVEKSSNNSNVGGWLLGLGIAGVIIYGLIKGHTP
jgi:hypothetical protein